MKLNKLTSEEEKVILEKGTELPGTGEYEKFDGEGIYTCRQCNAYLYRSDDKFDARCGWPAFDDEINGAVNQQSDVDGRRVEITCNRCGGHLGHVFEGEKLTEKDVRHCVNSISMRFLEKENVQTEKTIYLGGGCFWCIEAVFKMIEGIKDLTSGYSGGEKENPAYNDICTGETGHAEVVKLIYDPTIISLEKILDVFFSSHDPTTVNKQGNDVGTQYRSVIFVEDNEDLKIVESFINKISESFSNKVVTETKLLDKFYPAEDYHQDYFERNNQAPYCQLVINPKVEKIKKKYLDK